MDFAGCVVHRHDRAPDLARDPFVGAGVLMQHHARHRGALAPHPVLSLGLPLGRCAGLPQLVLDPAAGASAAAVPAMVMVVADVPAVVVGAVIGDELQHLIHGRCVVGLSPQSPVEHGLHASVIVLLRPPPEGPRTRPACRRPHPG